MNRIPEIAQMFGVEIGEEFNIKGCIDDFRFKFTEEDIGYFYNGKWVSILCYLGNLLNGKWELVKIPKSLLTEKEKEYLSAVIKPFKDKVIYIAKQQGFKYSKKISVEFIIIYVDDEKIILPSYDKGTLYKDMKLMEKYTVEDLGL